MNKPALTEITLEDIESLAVGASILGTGGGGSPYLGLLNLRRLYAEGYRVQLMSPLDLDDDDRVAVVSNMGAPLIGQERLADSRNIARAVEMQEEFGGFKFRAVMSVEIGGGNGTQALMAAAHLNIPVVDADCMGRAFPEAQMTSVAIGGLRPYPARCTIRAASKRSSRKCQAGNGWSGPAARSASKWARSPRPARRPAPAAR